MGFGRHGVLDLSSSDWFNLLLASFVIRSRIIGYVSYIFEDVFCTSDFLPDTPAQVGVCPVEDARHG